MNVLLSFNNLFDAESSLCSFGTTEEMESS